MAIAKYLARWLVALGLIGALLWMLPIPWDVLIMMLLIWFLPILGVLYITGIIKIDIVGAYGELASMKDFRERVEKFMKDIREGKDKEPEAAEVV